jgi:L-rhamnose mutarotase
VVSNLKRAAFKMKLKHGYENDYKKRHEEIWEDLVKELHDAGISDYSIFLDYETDTLFAVQKLDDDNTADMLPMRDIVKKWWSYMADIMDTNPDNSPVQKDLVEVFHID